MVVGHSAYGGISQSFRISLHCLGWKQSELRASHLHLTLMEAHRWIGLASSICPRDISEFRYIGFVSIVIDFSLPVPNVYGTDIQPINP